MEEQTFQRVVSSLNKHWEIYDCILKVNANTKLNILYVFKCFILEASN